MQQVDGDDFLSRGIIHDSSMRLKNGPEKINEDRQDGQAKFLITPESIGKRSDFLENQQK